MVDIRANKQRKCLKVASTLMGKNTLLLLSVLIKKLDKESQGLHRNYGLDNDFQLGLHFNPQHL